MCLSVFERAPSSCLEPVAFSSVSRQVEYRKSISA
jgi:hypothetical protein